MKAEVRLRGLVVKPLPQEAQDCRILTLSTRTGLNYFVMKPLARRFTAKGVSRREFLWLATVQASGVLPQLVSHRSVGGSCAAAKCVCHRA
mmetsp:Transcript_42487/g.84094  ORF Transcript_42487/g.84094 Transcript_42487/m.84094 type:complete len:91 (-) Transcript_42487:260-532(-)